MRHDFIRTITGRHIHLDDLLGLPSEKIQLTDIAGALAKIARFGGQTEYLYSVAAHSVAVARLLPARLRLYGLLHDAAEAYLGDVVAPWKPHTYMGFTGGLLSIGQVEALVLRAIHRVWPGREPGIEAAEMIRHADKRAGVTEARYLCHADADAEWGGWMGETGIEPIAPDELPGMVPPPRWTPSMAEYVWTTEFKKALAEVKRDPDRVRCPNAVAASEEGA